AGGAGADGADGADDGGARLPPVARLPPPAKVWLWSPNRAQGDHNHTFAPTPRCAVGEPALPRRQISWWQTLTDSPRNLTCSPAFPTGSPPPSNPCVAKDASPKRISRRPSNSSAAPCWMRTWQCPRRGPSQIG